MNEIERNRLSSDLLRTFVAIAESGSLTLAARRLHRTQSAISVQLRKIEAELSASLFHRNPKGMVLTEAGEKLLPAARNVLVELDRARALFREPLMGRIRIGIPDDFDDTVLARTLAVFARRHPAVDVIATSGCTSSFREAIDSGALDVAVRSSPEGVAPGWFSKERTVWAAGRTAVLAHDEPIPLAVLDRNCWWRDLPVEALNRQGRRYVVAFRSSSFASLKAAIRACFAIGVLPESSLAEDMNTLTAADGFPALPASYRTILVRPDAPKHLTDAMRSAIEDACLRNSNLWSDALSPRIELR